MSTKPFYGHILGAGKGTRQTLKASENYNMAGGHFVTNNSGTYELADASDAVAGWAEVGKLAGFGKSYYTSASGSEALIINGADDVFRLPAVHTVSKTDIGKAYELYTDNSHSAAAVKQYVHNTGTTKTTGPVIVHDVDAEDIANTTIQVKLNRAGMVRA